MKFTQEQQTFIDDLIKTAVGRAYRTAASEKTALTAATERTAELEEQLTKSREGLRDAELKAAAMQGGAHHPPDVAFLLRDAVKIDDDGGMLVVDEDGKQRYDKEGSPLSIDGFVADFLQKNTHFAKALPASGSGGGSFLAGLFK